MSTRCTFSAAAVVLLFVVTGCSSTETAQRPEGRVIAKYAKSEPQPIASAEMVTGGTSSSQGVLVQRAFGAGVVSIPALESYLTGIAKRVSAKWPGEAVPFRVVVRPTNSLPPHSKPDGTIVVPVGFVKSVEYEDEIAFVLGHELSHLLLGHFAGASMQEYQRSAYGTATLGIAALQELQKQRGIPTPVGSTDAKRAALANEAVMDAGETLLYPKWTRRQEDEADLLGIDLAIESGFSPLGARYFLQKLAHFEVHEDEHIKLISSQLEGAAADVAADSSGRSEFASSMRKGLNWAVEKASSEMQPALEEVRRRHHFAQEREKAVVEYVRREYPDLERKDLSTDQLDVVRKGDAQVADMLAGLNAANAARESLATSDLRQAEIQATKGISGPTAHLGYTRLVMADVRTFQNNQQDAEQELLVAKSDSLAPLQVEINLAEVLMADKKYQDAERVLEAALGEFGDTGVKLYVPLIKVYEELKKPAKVAEVRARCTLTGDRELMAACSKPAA
jgi:predicted Zn-dependent protease